MRQSKSDIYTIYIRKLKENYYFLIKIVIIAVCEKNITSMHSSKQKILVDPSVSTTNLYLHIGKL